jgi:hypothetical protein
VSADVGPSSPILVILMMEALSSPETSVLTRATRRNIQEDTILYSHRSENLKSCEFFRLAYNVMFSTEIQPTFRSFALPLPLRRFVFHFILRP